jgi:EmrB/QacA subfamily drug resistance transporter
MLSVTALIVSIGRIGDMFGKKKLYLYGIAIFTVSSIACGISMSIFQLIFFRFIQGIGGSILITSSFAIISDVIPKKELSKGISILTSAIPIGFALGSPIGGFLLKYFSWRALFFLNVPIGIITILFALFFPNIVIQEKKSKFDFKGMILLVISITGYVLFVTYLERHSLDINAISIFIFTVIMLFLFYFVEKNTNSPLIKLELLKNGMLRSSLFICIIIYAVINGFCMIFPFYLENTLNMSTNHAGLLLMFAPLGCALFTPLSTYLGEKIGYNKIMSIGILLFTLGTFTISIFNKTADISIIAITIFLFNGSLAFFQTPNNTIIMANAQPNDRGLTAGLLNLARTLGQTTGTAVIGSIYYFFINFHSSLPLANKTTSSMQNTFLIATVIMILTFIITILVYKPWKNIEYIK